MLKKIKLGDRVHWVDQPWSGIVQEISGARAYVLLDDGFTEWAPLSQLILKNDLDISFEEAPSQEKNETRHLEVRPIILEEIDLHIENLFVHWRSIPTSDILARQLHAFKEELQTCKRAKVDELIVIHGKGSGILKRNILEILNGHTNISLKEMNSGKYKQAAIKIYFHRPL